MCSTIFTFTLSPPPLIQEGELLALATSSSEDKTAAHLLSSEVRSLKETVESLQEEQKKTQKEHRAQLEAVQGVCHIHVHVLQ